MLIFSTANNFVHGIFVRILDQRVGILRCRDYDRQEIKACFDRFAASLDFVVPPGCRILLKPNLVSGQGHDGLGCTHPEFVAGVAEWCVDQGARVAVGDSPAFGSGQRVMQFCGMSSALRGLPVKTIHFSRGKPKRLDCGIKVAIAPEALDCDFLINLPKVKAHAQVRVTLAVKNYFGVVSGWKKAWLHMRCGERENLFESLLVDLLQIVPSGFSFIDGIVAMHKTGPITGDPFLLGLVAGSANPVALDAALLDILAVSAGQSMVQMECIRRDMPGSRSRNLSYPFLCPKETAVPGFQVPQVLDRVRFQPGQIVKSCLKRAYSRIIPG